MSEGLRAALTPLEHMKEGYILLGLVVFLFLLTSVGMKGFARRVVS